MRAGWYFATGEGRLGFPNRLRAASFLWPCSGVPATDFPCEPAVSGHGGFRLLRTLSHRVSGQSARIGVVGHEEEDSVEPKSTTSCPVCEGQDDPDLAPSFPGRIMALGLFAGLAAVVAASPVTGAAIAGTLILLTISVAAHELGHLRSALRHGVTVSEFSVGFGPVLAVGRRWQVPVTLRLVLLIGFTRIIGGDSGDRLCTQHTGSVSLMSESSRRVQSRIMLGGIAYNMVLAWVGITAAMYFLAPMKPATAILAPIATAAAVVVMTAVGAAVFLVALIFGASALTSEGGSILSAPGQLETVVGSHGSAVGAVLLFFGTINLMLAAFNVLPLAPLDGNHIALLAWDKVQRRRTGRPVSLKAIGRFRMAGGVVVGLAMIRFLVEDLIRFLS